MRIPTPKKYELIGKAHLSDAELRMVATLRRAYDQGRVDAAGGDSMPSPCRYDIVGIAHYEGWRAYTAEVNELLKWAKEDRNNIKHLERCYKR